MAKKLYEESKIAAIAVKIREKAGTENTYTTVQMPEGIESVYGKGAMDGYEKGTQDGYDAGFAAGEKAQYDTFWEKYLDGNLSYLFAGGGWTDDNFCPPKNITIPTNGNNANSMFYQTGIKDLKGCLDRQNIYIDATQYNGSNSFYNWFAYSSVTHVGRILFPEIIYRWNGAFTECKALHTIDELRSTEITSFAQTTFQNCTKLCRMIVAGIIAKDYFDVHWSTLLDKESIISIMNALSASTTGLSVTLSQTAVNNAFETSEGAADGVDSTEWIELAETKPNWNIVLA